MTATRTPFPDVDSATDAAPSPAPSPQPSPQRPGQPTPSPARTRLGRPFAAQLTSTGLANLGDGIVATLTPLVALGLTTSPVQLSLVSAATWLPWLLFGLAAGVLVDRADRRRVQIGALVARAVILTSAAVAAAFGALTMPLILAMVLAYGATEVVADLGATSIVPDLVPTDSLSAANGRVVGVQQVTNSFIGAPLAGALIVAGAGFGFGAGAALAALAAGVLAVGLRGSFRPRVDDGATRPTRAESPSALAAVRAGVATAAAEVRAGLAFLARHPLLRPLVITSAVLNLASTGYFAVFLLWAVGPDSHYGLTEAQYPLLMLGFALGAVGGSLLAQRIQRLLGELPTIVVMLTANSLLLLVPIWLTNGLWLAALLALVGALNTIGNVVSMSLRQRLVPRELLGRVGGAARTLAYGLIPIGALLGGVVAQVWGLTATFVAAVVLSVAVCGYLALSVRGANAR